MPPMSTWYRGRDRVAAFLVEHALAVDWRHIPTQANGQLAVGCYRWVEERDCFVGEIVDVLTLRGNRIADVTAFVTPAILPSFGLPAVLAR